MIWTKFMKTLKQVHHVTNRHSNLYNDTKHAVGARDSNKTIQTQNNKYHTIILSLLLRCIYNLRNIHIKEIY
jgi:hypothetical protein